MKSSFHSPQRASTSMSGTRRSQSQKSLSSSMSSLPNSMSLASLPEISSPYNNGPATFDSSVKSNMKASSLFGNHSGPPSGRSDHLSLENRALANELSSRTTT